jgi:predicted DNA binding protein
VELIEASILAKGQQTWMDAVTSKYRARFRLMHSKPSPRRDEILQLFEVVVDEHLKDRMLRYLLANQEISELEVANSSHGRIVGLMRAKGVIMRCIADSDCFLVHATGEHGAPVRWEVLGTKQSLRRLMARLKRKGIRYSIASISALKRPRVLTTRQEWLLRSAFERGYFDYPKRIHIRSLAKLLGVSAPTLHESLKKTQRRLIEEHFGDRSLLLAIA